MLKANRLRELISDSGYVTMQYSGRGMYGRHCLAYTVPGSDLLGSVAEICAGATEREHDSLVRIFQSACTDNMGRDDLVVYFPSIAYDESAAANEDDEYAVVDEVDDDGEYTFISPADVTLAELKPQVAVPMKIVAVIGFASDWAAYSGSAELSNSKIAREGDKLSEEAARALYPLIARTLNYRQ